MNEIKIMEELIGQVKGVKLSLESSRLGLIYMSSGNDVNLSSYHQSFDRLIKKYTGFADNYKIELDDFNKDLLNKLNVLHKERELEIISNCSINGDNNSNYNNNNNEFTDNSVGIDSDSSSLNNMINSAMVKDIGYNSSVDNRKISEPKPTPKPEPEPVPTYKPMPKSPPTYKPEPVPTYKPKPKPNANTVKVEPPKVSKPKNIPKPRNTPKVNNNQRKPKNISKPRNTPKPKVNNKNNQQNIRKNAAQNKSSSTEEYKQNGYDNGYDNDYMNDMIANLRNQSQYKYDPSKVNFKFEGVHRCSTTLFIGNLPFNITENRIITYMIKNFHINYGQIGFVKYNEGSGHCLVRLRENVKLGKIRRIMNKINESNKKEKEERSKALYYNQLKKKKSSKVSNNKSNKNTTSTKKDNKKDKKQKKGPISWQKNIYIKFNSTAWYYQNEEDMYNDPDASCNLFVRNFDILNKSFHSEFTSIFSEFGSLWNDIEIKRDRYGDPYAEVIFNNKNDAIKCCNTVIDFYGRTLEIRYNYKA